MKNLLITLLFAGVVSAQDWVEERTYIIGGAATPRVDGLITNPLKEKIGTFIWFQVQRGYSQAYTGLTYSPKPWVQLAIGGGLEEDKHSARLGSYIWLGKGKVSSLVVFEDGGSGKWFKVENNYQITKTFSIGSFTERFNGTGPRLGYSIPHTKFNIWGSTMFTDKDVRHVVGLRFSL